ncbi:MAG: hypothetical protein ACTSWY_01135 [Promethearchaeota archaeon]
MKSIVIGMKVLLTLSLIWMFTMFWPVIDFNIIAVDSITTLFETIYRLIAFGTYSLFQGLWTGLFGLTFISFRSIPPFYNDFHSHVSGMLLDEMIKRWFGFPEGYTGIDAAMDFSTLSGNLYVLGFQIIGLLMIIYGIMSILRTDDIPKYCIRTVFFLNLMIVIPLMLLGLQNMLQILIPTLDLNQMLGLYAPEADPSRLNMLPYPLYENFTTMQISHNLFIFLGSSIFQIALSAFIYLELSFQLNYIYQVTSPIEERGERLLYQIDSVKRAAKEAVVDLEKIKKEKEEEKDKKKFEMDQEGNIIEKKKIVTVKQFLSKTATGFSHIKEMIEKRKLEEKAKKRIEALRDTRRLSLYLNKLLGEDSEAEMTLTARSSAPSAGKLIQSTIIDILFRILGITLLVFVIAQTEWVLKYIFLVPPALFESVEMFTPEIILTLLIPIILLFPIISIIIRSSKSQHLRLKLKQEQDRRLKLEEQELMVA